MRGVAAFTPSIAFGSYALLSDWFGRQSGLSSGDVSPGARFVGGFMPDVVRRQPVLSDFGGWRPRGWRVFQRDRVSRNGAHSAGSPRSSSGNRDSTRPNARSAVGFTND